MKRIYNFSNSLFTKSIIYNPSTISELKRIKRKRFTTIGNLKSYGDSCLGRNKLISLKNFNKLIYFDKKKRTIEVESGMKIKDLLKITLKYKLLLKCLPGSKYVTVGGIVASNIKGKLTIKNSLHNYIESIKLIDKNNNIITCSKLKNKKLFKLTIGGLGMTGIILSVKFKLSEINSQTILEERVFFSSFQNLKSKLKRYKKKEYALAWLNTNTTDMHGILFYGSHYKKNNYVKIKKDYLINSYLCNLISFISNNKIFVILFNKIFTIYNIIFKKKKINLINFYFPQDRLRNFNDFFKPHGFIQFQFFLKFNDLKKIYFDILNELKLNNLYSNFCILKFCKNDCDKSDILISFDIPINKNKSIINNMINKLVKKHEINITLSKDMSLRRSSINDKILNTHEFLKIENRNYLINNFSSYLRNRLHV